jgi:hypothetical protein
MVGIAYLAGRIPPYCIYVLGEFAIDFLVTIRSTMREQSGAPSSHIRESSYRLSSADR